MKQEAKRKRLLEKMEAVIPRPARVALLEPQCPKVSLEHRPMLCIYVMQQWFNLSDSSMNDALYDDACMRAFFRLDLFDESMPTKRPVRSSAACWRNIN